MSESEPQLFEEEKKEESKPAKAKQAKVKAVTPEQYTELLNRVEQLEACLSKVATDAGQGNTLKSFGLKRVNPTISEMRKHG